MEVRRVGKEKELGKGTAERGSFNVDWQDVILQLISGLDGIGQGSFFFNPHPFSSLLPQYVTQLKEIKVKLSLILLHLQTEYPASYITKKSKKTCKGNLG